MKSLVKELKKLLKHNEVMDIIVFGSYVKGRINPRDIDIIVLSNKELPDLKARICQIISKDADVQFVSLLDYDKFIWVTMIREGFSVKHNKYLFEIYKMKPVVLFKYSLKQLGSSKKVMFERAIKNFKNIEKLSNRVVLVGVEQAAEFSDFLRYWNIDLDSREYALLPLLRK